MSNGKIQSVALAKKGQTGLVESELDLGKNYVAKALEYGLWWG